MNRSSVYCMTILLALFVAWPSCAQQPETPAAGPSGPGSPVSNLSGTPGQPPPSRPVGPISDKRGQPGLNQPQIQTPIYVRGRIVMDSGRPVPEPVSVSLGCGLRSLQVIHTDMKGYFQFALGGGAQSNMDFSASSDAPSPMSPGDNSMQFPRGRFGGSERMLTGCEVQVSVPGYMPLTKTITDHADITGIEVGTLQLTRVAGVTGSSISVTSLLVPNGARKEFEKGDKEARSNHLDLATQHLEKAVAQYDKYASAWTELGNLYATKREVEKSRQSFTKAIEADPHYIPSYLGLADLEFHNQEFQLAVDTAGKALELNPSIGVAHFIQAIGNFKLNRLDAAEKSAQLTEKGPHQNMPDLHALHAELLLRKKDYSNAAAQMRAYLKEFPKGRFADQMKKELQQLQSSLTADNSAQAQTAP